jgi:aminopeptidase YwaD
MRRSLSGVLADRPGSATRALACAALARHGEAVHRLPAGAVVATTVVALLLAGCDGSSGSAADDDPDRITPAPGGTVSTSPSPTHSSTAAAPRPVRFRPAAVRRTVVYLAGGIGPRQATSPAYQRAAAWVEQRFRSLGYDVTRQYLPVPSGVSWGIPVPAGRTWNVVARPDDLRSGEPYRIVSAHLDTVPQAPGAEDDASGIGVILELARMAARREPSIPVVFVAFAAEEPRGAGDDEHHFGSRAMVRRLHGSARQQLGGMVSLDRVGVGNVVPVCSGGFGTPTIQPALLREARRARIPAQGCVDQASDHWSFSQAGIPAARVGGTPYAAYHSAADLPAVVQEAQLNRVGRLMWAWINS